MNELIEKLFIFTENFTEKEFFNSDMLGKKDKFNKQFNLNLTLNEYRDLEANSSMTRLYDDKKYSFKKV